MAGLFKNRIIKEKIGLSSIPDLEKKIAVVKKWHSAYYDTSSSGLKSKTAKKRGQAPFN